MKFSYLRRNWNFIILVFIASLVGSCSYLDNTGSNLKGGNEQCGVYEVKNYTTFLGTCKLPTASWDGKGPALRTDLALNCKNDTGYIYSKTYTWTMCLNEITLPSSKPILTTGGGCLFEPGTGCQISGTLGDIDPSLETGSAANILLAYTYSRIAEVLRQAQGEGGQYLDQRLKMLDSAQLFADVALEEFRNGNDAAGSASVSVALQILDAASDFVPGVSLVKDSIIVGTGFNIATLSQVSDTQRAVTLGTLLLPSMAAGTVKQFENVASVLAKVANSEAKSARVAEGLLNAIRKSDDEMLDLINLIPCQASNSRFLQIHIDIFQVLFPEAYAASKCRKLGTITAEIVQAGDANLKNLKAGKTSFGTSVRKDYAKTYRQHYANLDDEIGQVHHAVEQQVMGLYPGVISEAELNSLPNLRGVPKGSAGTELHQKKIRQEWDQFYNAMSDLGKTPTKADLLKQAKAIDDKFGKEFVPPIR